jgi:hypothetical protein
VLVAPRFKNHEAFGNRFMTEIGHQPRPAPANVSQVRPPRPKTPLQHDKALLFIAKVVHGVQAGGADGGSQGRGDGDQEQHQGDCRERERIQRLHVEQEIAY